MSSRPFLSPAPAALLVLWLAAPQAAHAAPESYAAYLEASSGVCVGPMEARQAEPSTWERGGFRYTLDGASGSVRRIEDAAPQRFRLGVLNCVKDYSPETAANLAEYLARFRALEVDGIVLAGDSAHNLRELEQILELLAATDLPVYALIGNMESRAEFNAAVRAVHARRPNVLHLGLSRLIDADGVSLVSLPGYHDRRYIHRDDGCQYGEEDLASVEVLAERARHPVLLVAHGPPRQSGRVGLDHVPEVGNVGDPRLAEVLARSKVPFALFGHVQEAGGRGTDRAGRKELRPLAPAESLYLNPGAANSLPWKMNHGPESFGMAAILTFEGGQAQYEIIRSPQRVVLADD